jgi:type IV pilus assembly protein PilM
MKVQFQQLINKVQVGFNHLTPTSKVGPIGIDFGIEKVNLVQLYQTGDGYKILAAVSIPYTIEREQLLKDPDSLRELINDTLKDHNFKKRNVVAALPPNMMQLVLVNYQCTHEQDNDTILMQTISEQFAEKTEGAIIDYLPIRPKVREQLERSALVAIANHGDVTQFLETLRLAGLNTKSLEIGPVAIKRLLVNLEDKSDQLHKIMSINFAATYSFVTVLWDGELLLDRGINIGLDSIITAVSEALEISQKQAEQLMSIHGFTRKENTDDVLTNDFLDEDITTSLIHILKPIFIRFAEEIKKVLIYTAAETQGGAIDVVYIMGAIARWPMIDIYLSNLINLPVKKINPFFDDNVENEDIDTYSIEPVCGTAVASGLALHGITRHV